MRDISDMEVFIRTVRSGSMSQAARSFNVTPAAISYRLSKLENSLGTRLLHRTTRRLGLTQDGEEYLRQAERVISELGRLEISITRRDEEPQGVLKVTMPASFGRQNIAPVTPKFLKRYPKVQLNLVMSDEIIDIMAQGIDLAIRISRLEDSELIARKIAPDRRVVCASPDYLKRHGTPRTPRDLTKHNCLLLSQQPYWVFQGPHGLERIKIAGNFECNNGEVIREATCAGLGISLKATWDIASHLKRGKLVTVLDDYPIANDASIWAVYPSRHNVPAKVTAFVSFLKEHFDSQPHWDSIL